MTRRVRYSRPTARSDLVEVELNADVAWTVNVNVMDRLTRLEVNGLVIAVEEVSTQYCSHHDVQSINAVWTVRLPRIFLRLSKLDAVTLRLMGAVM